MFMRITYIAIAVIIAAGMFSSCGGKEEVKPAVNKTYYSLGIAKADSAASLNEELLRLSKAGDDTVFVYQDTSSSEYILKIGLYEDSLTAAWKGNRYFKAGIIEDFTIYREAVEIEDLFNSFLFVGYYLNRASLYKYDLLEDEYYLVWSKWGKKITDLHYKEEEVNTFFTTGFQIGVEGGFPFITDVRLYMHNRINNDTKLLQKFGKGLSVSSTWDNELLDVSFVELDSLKTMSVYRKDYRYDPEGIMATQSVDEFDLLNDGLPNKLRGGISIDSPDDNYSLAYEEAEDTTTIGIIENVRGKENLVGKYKGRLKHAEWKKLRDEVLVSLITESDTAETRTSIYIIDYHKYEIVDSIKTQGSGNFMVKGNLLFYDKGFGREAKIIIYDNDMRSTVDSILIRGGCGLTNIPQSGIR